eukprot:gene12135-8356_t
MRNRRFPTPFREYESDCLCSCVPPLLIPTFIPVKRNVTCCRAAITESERERPVRTIRAPQSVASRTHPLSPPQQKIDLQIPIKYNFFRGIKKCFRMRLHPSLLPLLFIELYCIFTVFVFSLSLSLDGFRQASVIAEHELLRPGPAGTTSSATSWEQRVSHLVSQTIGMAVKSSCGAQPSGMSTPPPPPAVQRLYATPRYFISSSLDTSPAVTPDTTAITAASGSAANTYAGPPPPPHQGQATPREGITFLSSTTTTSGGRPSPQRVCRGTGEEEENDQPATTATSLDDDTQLTSRSGGGGGGGGGGPQEDGDKSGNSSSGGRYSAAAARPPPVATSSSRRWKAPLPPPPPPRQPRYAGTEGDGNQNGCFDYQNDEDDAAEGGAITASWDSVEKDGASSSPPQRQRLFYVLRQKEKLIQDLTQELLESHAETERYHEALCAAQQHRGAAGEQENSTPQPGAASSPTTGDRTRGETHPAMDTNTNAAADHTHTYDSSNPNCTAMAIPTPSAATTSDSAAAAHSTHRTQPLHTSGAGVAPSPPLQPSPPHPSCSPADHDGGSQQPNENLVYLMRMEMEGQAERLASQDRLIQRLRSRLEQAKQEALQREHVIDVLQQEMNDALLKWESVVRDLRQAEHTMAVQALELDQLRVSERDAKAAFQTERRQLQAQLQAAEGRHRDQWEQLQAEVTHLSEDVGEVETVRQQHQRRAAAVEQQLSMALREGERLRQEVRDLQQLRSAEAALLEAARVEEKSQKVALLERLEREQEAVAAAAGREKSQMAVQLRLEQELQAASAALQTSTETIQSLQQALALKNSELQEVQERAVKKFEALLREEEEQHKSALSQVEYCVQSSEEMNKIVAAAEAKRRRAESKLFKYQRGYELLQLGARQQAANAAEEVLEQHRWAAQVLDDLHHQVQHLTHLLERETAKNVELQSSLDQVRLLGEVQEERVAAAEADALKAKTALKAALDHQLTAVETQRRLQHKCRRQQHLQRGAVQMLEGFQRALWAIVRGMQTVSAGARRDGTETAAGTRRPTSAWRAAPHRAVGALLGPNARQQPSGKQGRTKPPSGRSSASSVRRRLGSWASTSSASTSSTTCTHTTAVSCASHASGRESHGSQRSRGEEERAAGDAAEKTERATSVLCSTGMHLHGSRLAAVLHRLQLLVHQLSHACPVLARAQAAGDQLRQERRRLQKELSQLRQRLQTVEQRASQAEAEQTASHEKFLRAAESYRQWRRQWERRLSRDVLLQAPAQLSAVLQHLAQLLLTAQERRRPACASAAPPPRSSARRGEKLCSAQVGYATPAAAASSSCPLHGRGDPDALGAADGAGPEWYTTALVRRECDDLVHALLGLEGGWEELTAAASASSACTCGPVPCTAPRPAAEEEEEEEDQVWGESGGEDHSAILLLLEELIQQLASFPWTPSQQQQLQAYVAATMFTQPSQEQYHGSASVALPPFLEDWMAAARRRREGCGHRLSSSLAAALDEDRNSADPSSLFRLHRLCWMYVLEEAYAGLFIAFWEVWGYAAHVPVLGNYAPLTFFLF